MILEIDALSIQYSTHFIAALCLSKAFLFLGAGASISETGPGPPNKILGVRRDPFLTLLKQRRREDRKGERRRVKKREEEKRRDERKDKIR